MAIDNEHVIIGAPNQSATTGAVQWAPVGTSTPTDARSVLTTPWKSGGYVNSDGVSLAIDQDTTTIDDWSLAHVRTLLQGFTGTVTFTFIQTDYETLCMIFGEDNVTLTNATAEHGAVITVKIGPSLPKPLAFCINMKDAEQRIRLALPNAQPKLDGDLTFKADEAISWSLSLDCAADADGKCIYLIYDDGKVSA